MSENKIKKIPKEYFITILDRLSRFEPAQVRYQRVFDDIINKFYNTDKSVPFDIKEKCAIIENIINTSLDKDADFDPYINNIIQTLEEKYFKVTKESYQYLSARLNFKKILDNIELTQNLQKNVTFLKYLSNSKEKIEFLREKYSLLYPIEKIILCEGQTEYTLLETLVSLFNINFSKKGVMVIPAGGKNQVARKYYKMLEYTKIPFFILLDKDAQLQKELIEPKLRDIDSLYLIKSGEFEDLIPLDILKNTINSIHCFEFNCEENDFDKDSSMVANLENIYKKYGFGEFKKAKFALELKNYIAKNCSKEDFLSSEIVEIVNNLA